MIQFDRRLLRNFYLNKGFYNVEINSSFAKLIKNDEFELVYNINANDKFFFGDLSIQLPADFDDANYNKINSLFDNIKDKPYSINSVSKILDEIDLISINEQYQSVKSQLRKKLFLTKLIYHLKLRKQRCNRKINIYGNNITRESVIRNQLIIDEGDIFNEILVKKILMS